VQPISSTPLPLVDAEIGSHPRQPLAGEDREGPHVRAGAQRVEACVEMVGTEGDRVDRPYLRILGAGGAERDAMPLGQRLEADARRRHRRAKRGQRIQVSAMPTIVQFPSRRSSA
jgi:hypothetical protein